MEDIGVVKDKAYWERRYSELTLASDFLFCYIMSQKKYCTRLLQLLGFVGANVIDVVIAQDTIHNEAEGKYIRLDIFVVVGNVCYDIEMQANLIPDLGLRARYYQSCIDSMVTRKGTRYKDLKGGEVVFICLKDAYGRGWYKYPFHSWCDYDISLVLGDKVGKTVYNCSAWAKCPDRELAAFLRYLYDGVPTTQWTLELDAEVKAERLRGTWRDRFVTEEMFRNICLSEGESIGEMRGDIRRAEKTARVMLGYRDSLDKIVACTELPLDRIVAIKTSMGL